MRDVVETPLDEVFDVNGWDLVKAVDLVVRGNATVAEWLRSPIVYRGDEDFRDALLDLATRAGDRGAIGRHYVHLGRLQWQRHGDAERMPLKRFFYALRPAVAVAWMRARPEETLPPMDLPTLVAGVDLPPGVAEEVGALVAAKARQRELGVGAVPRAAMAFVADQLADESDFAQADPADVAHRRDDAARTFRALVHAHAPAPGGGR